MNEDVNKKFLSKEEQLQLELNFEKQSGLTKKITIAQQESKIILQNQKMLELQIEIFKLQNKEMKAKTDQLIKDREKLKGKNRDYTKAIADKYELDEGWGFNPDTGEII